MLTNIFYENFLIHSSEIAIIWKDRHYKYYELIEDIKNFREYLAKNEIEQGSRVAIFGDFTPKSISLLFALIEIKTIIIPLTKSSLNDQEKYLSIAEAEYFFYLNDEDEFTFSVFNKIKKSVHQIYIDLSNIKEPGLVLFSSGTSGEPKCAVHNFNKLLIKYSYKRKTLRTLNFLLFDHWGGLNTMFHILSNGGMLVSVKDRSPEGICQLIQKYKIQLLPTTPTFLNLLLLNPILFEKYDLSSLEIITYGAEPMPKSTLNRISDKFKDVKLLQTYGLIELGVMRSKSEDNNSLWFKIEDNNYKIKIVNKILYIKTDSAMLGYLNAPSPFDEDGWFITGDEVEEKGEYIRVLGRKSEIINVGGEKVYPQEVENIIKEIENIFDVLVFGESNNLVGTIVCAKVKLINSEDKKDVITRIKLECKKHLPSFKIPVKIFFEESEFFNDRFKKKRN
uniref:ANL family adenylate-forming protein n=1 Tax=Algoriphagus sp. TaxID=1872435 RepID=UPI004047C17E